MLLKGYFSLYHGLPQNSLDRVLYNFPIKKKKGWQEANAVNTFFNPFCDIIRFFKGVFCLCHLELDFWVLHSVDKTTIQNSAKQQTKNGNSKIFIFALNWIRFKQLRNKVLKGEDFASQKL